MSICMMRSALVLFSLSLSLLTGCGSSDDSGATVAVSMKLSTNTQAIMTFLNKTSSLDAGSTGTNLLFNTNARSGETAIAAASASGLLSYKYFITSIQICQSMTVNGTGFSAQSGCLTIYSGPTDSNFTQATSPTRSDYLAQMNYAKTSDTGYIDLMSAESRAKLGSSVTVTKENAHYYSWGLINWAYPIKYKASLTDPTGALKLYSH
ncbi:MAG: hypothetical protein AAB116_23825, partial [Candidatus Poribacteria bacterium]